MKETLKVLEQQRDILAKNPNMGLWLSIKRKNKTTSLA
jgi:hypothetical protein